MKFNMKCVSLKVLAVVVVVIGLLTLICLCKKENFDNQLDVIPWNKICKKEYCDHPNYNTGIYPNKKGYGMNTVYTINGKCCRLSEEILKCLSSRGSNEHCKNLF